MSARRSFRATGAVVLLLAGAGVVHAYPQFQLRDAQTCTSCHLAPGGGGLLNGMGLSSAEDLGQFESDAAVLHGAAAPPHWLTLGGDVRIAGGSLKGRTVHAAFFPMELDLRAAARAGAFSLYATVGGGMPNEDDPSTALLMTEHYVMWKQRPGRSTGIFARVGRFLPVYGLRLAEHTAYVRQFVTPLYSESYGAALSYVSERLEVHAGGFLHDPWRYSSEHGDGATIHAELRLGEIFVVGGSGRHVVSDDDTRTSGGLIGKVAIRALDLVLSTEVDTVRQTIAAGGARTQTAAVLVASWFPHRSFMADVGVGRSWSAKPRQARSVPAVSLPPKSDAASDQR